MITLYLAFAFVIVAGACVGSFLNVVIYRVPEGRSIVHPGSSCPKCGHKLAWYDNVPVLGWLWLRGKCRYCAAPIAAQYPIIEAVTALLFGLWFAVCYLTPLRPGFSVPPGDETGMIFAVSLVLIGALIASTVIDARLYIIPLSITWLVTAVGIVGLTLAVWLFPRSVVHAELPPVERMTPRERVAAVDEDLRSAAEVRAAALTRDPGPVTLSAAPWVSAPLAGAGLGGAIGLALALGLLRAGVLKVSFADEADEPAHPDRGAVGSPDDEPLESHDENVAQLWLVLAPVIGGTVAAIATQDNWSTPAATPSWLTAVGGILIGYAVLVAAVAVGSSVRPTPVSDQPAAADDDDGVVFQPHPHTRREIMKEVAFIAFPLVGLILGSIIAAAAVGTPGASDAASRWPDPLHVLGGTLLGYLIGGGVVWVVRILGSLLFGKEAMGLGDVHLMGAVGAVCGWRVAMTAFFLAAFLGVIHAVLSIGFGKLIRSRGRQMPFGPQLAAATFIVMVWREPIATYFMSLF